MVLEPRATSNGVRGIFRVEKHLMVLINAGLKRTFVILLFQQLEML